MYDRWLVFTTNNCRWIKLPVGHAPILSPGQKALKNPSTLRLMDRKVPMVYWKLADNGGQVAEMTALEKKQRAANIHAFGTDNVIKLPLKVRRLWNTRAMLWFMLGWSLASSLGWLLLYIGAE